MGYYWGEYNIISLHLQTQPAEYGKQVSQKMTKCSETNVLHFLRDVPRSPLDVCIFAYASAYWPDSDSVADLWLTNTLSARLICGSQRVPLTCFGFKTLISSSSAINFQALTLLGLSWYIFQIRWRMLYTSSTDLQLPWSSSLCGRQWKSTRKEMSFLSNVATPGLLLRLTEAPWVPKPTSFSFQSSNPAPSKVVLIAFYSRKIGLLKQNMNRLLFTIV